MASAPPSVVNRPELAPKLLGITDAVAETRGAGVMFIDDGRLRRLRPADRRGVTVVYEWRPRPALFAPQSALRVNTSGKASPPRDASSSPAKEWMNLGFNCGGAALAWVGVVGLGSLTPFTAGVGGFAAAFLYAGAIAASAQCVVSVIRTSNLYTGNQSWNKAMDESPKYVLAMQGTDTIGLIGGGGALIELKAARSALTAKGFTFSRAMKPSLDQNSRRKLTKSLGIYGVRTAPAVVINRYVKQRLLDGVAGAIGLVASSVSGITNDMIVWIIADDAKDR